MKTNLDYLRVSTWDFTEYTLLVSKITELYGNWRPGKWLQYVGKKSDHAFFGVGSQNGQRHHVIHFSGPDADFFSGIIKTYESFYCTRMDLERTIEKESDYDGYALYERAKSNNNRRNVSIILSSTGSTIYLGNRTSDSMVRIYEKEIDGLEFLRLEIEVKGETAKRSWESLKTQHHTKNQLFRGLLTRFTLPESIQKQFLDDYVEDESFQLVKLAKEKNDRLNWLLNLEPTIQKMLNDHGTGQIVRNMLERILENVDEH